MRTTADVKELIMPLGRSIARLNRIGLNRVTRHLGGWMPGFGVVIHRGRKSGKEFRTPVNVFVRDGLYVFALTYGRNSDWVKNVLAASGGEIQTRRSTFRMTNPRIEHQETRADLPLFVRTILHLTNVHDYLLCDQGTQVERSS